MSSVRPVVHSWPIAALTVMLLAGCGDDSPASAADLADRAELIGVPENTIYVVDLDDYQPAPQSLGTVGENTFGVAYASSSGGVAMLTVTAGEMTDDTCPDQPISGASFNDPVECEADGDGWYRTSGDYHEYTAMHGNAVVALSATTDAVEADALKGAVLDAHQPSSEQLDELFAEVEKLNDREPVERGDIPGDADGAPINPDGSGAAG